LGFPFQGGVEEEAAAECNQPERGIDPCGAGGDEQKPEDGKAKP